MIATHTNFAGLGSAVPTSAADAAGEQTGPEQSAARVEAGPVAAVGNGGRDLAAKAGSGYGAPGSSAAARSDQLFVWTLTPAQYAILKTAGIEPWMIHPSGVDSGWLHSTVYPLGWRRMFAALDNVQALLVREIVNDTKGGIKDLLRELRRDNSSAPELFSVEESAWALLSTAHRLAAIHTAREYDRLVRTLKHEVSLEERV